jgi:putative flavoprotein involved in K+ transport
MHVKFADEFSNKVKNMIDEFILKNQLSAPAPEFDDADVPDTNATCATQITSLDLEGNNIRSIIWTTGFNGDFSYIKLAVFDEEGNPEHQNGITDIEGLYFLGLPWLSARKSSIIFGIKNDAAFINEKVNEYSQQFHLSMPA